ncbi:HEPN domain-containing protein [Stenotrophomonas sp. 59]|uniref:HEPN domain-containing protein n=1 Tax=Stenotrophomonas sp. 59 TaxID=3051120 RepID=UPI00256EB0E9|nr:HEPN domain-containing protein [Stenotrophomonas sp. 59]
MSEAYRKERGRWQGGVETKAFAEALGADVPREWAEEFVAGLESLPWQHTAYVRFPGEIDPALIGTDGINLTPTLKLIPSAQLPDVPDGVGFATLGSLLLSQGARRQEKAIYLRLIFSGYISRDRESAGVNQITASILSIFGIAMSIGLLSHNPWHYVRKRVQSFSIDTYRLSGAEENYCENIAFDPSHAKEMDKLIHIIPDDTRSKPLWIQARISTLGKVMDRANSRLLNAARWYFDSHCGPSDQVRFVQVCIALEILLGDEKQGRETGLGVLMANRCAYLLGKNNADRESITSTFRLGYDIRSKIVHAGKSQLSSEEKAHFRYMQKLCSSVIQKECEELQQ